MYLLLISYIFKMVKIQCISMEPHHCPAIDYILLEGKEKRKLHFKDRFSIQRAPLPAPAPPLTFLSVTDSVHSNMYSYSILTPFYLQVNDV